MISGCVKQTEPVVEFSIEGYDSALDGNHLLIYDSAEIKLIDLTQKKLVNEISLPSPAWVSGIDISGDIIVWSDLRNEKTDPSALEDIGEANADIFLYNFKTKEQKQITSELSAQINPKIWGNYLVWQDNRNDVSKEYPGRWSLYLYNIDTGKEKLITSTLAPHAAFDIRDNQIVWEDERNFKGTNEIRGGENIPQNNKDIYLYDIAAGKEIPIATGSFMESNPDVCGHYVVWEDRNNGTLNADIALYDLSTKQIKYLTKDKYNQGTPQIYGNYVVWMDERRGTSSNDVYINGKAPNSDIFLYDLKNKKEVRLTGDGPQIQPSISSEWVAFTYSKQVSPMVQVVRYK
jgi:beta propeller repeat protein